MEAEVLVQNGDEVYPAGDVDVFMEEDSIFADAAFEQQMDGDQESELRPDCRRIVRT